MKKSILLVSEDPAVRRMIFRLLTSDGCKVVAVGESGPSTESISRTDCGLILIDSDVTEEQLRKIIEPLGPANGCPPAIILSNRADAIVPSGLKVSAVMEKPLDPEKLLGMIRDLLPDDAPLDPTQADPSPAAVKPDATQAKCLH